MSLAERQQRAYDSREVSVLEQIRSGVDPFTAAINAIRGIRIPYNKQSTGSSIFDIFAGIGDAVASIWGVNTSNLSRAVSSQLYEGNYNIAQGKSFAGGTPVGYSIYGAVRNASTPIPVFKESTTGTIALESGETGRIGGNASPGFEDFWSGIAPKDVHTLSESEESFPWGWVALAVSILGVFFLVRR